MLRTAWTIARKDLALFRRDRSAVLLTLALPVLLASIFGAAIGGMTGGGDEGDGPPKIEVWVEDLDQSTASRHFVEVLTASGGLRVKEVTDARKGVRNGDVGAALVLPAGYGAQLDAGEVPRVRLLRDPSQLITQQVVAGNLLPVLIETVAPALGASVMSRGLEELGFPTEGLEQADAIMRSTWESMDSLVGQLEAQGAFGEDDSAGGSAGAPMPAEGAQEDGGGGFDFLTQVPALLGVEAEDVVGDGDGSGPPRSAGGSHAVAAMAVMMLMFSLVAAGGTLLEEQNGGTLLRLQLAPSTGPTILIGKLIMLSAVGFLQLGVLFAYGRMVFGVPVFQAPLALAATSLGLVVASMGLGLVFATACRTQKQMEGLSTLVILVMSCVGGAWFPREITPEWFRTAGLFTITAYAMDAFHGVLWYGKGLLSSGEVEGVWRDVAVLLAIGVVLNAVAFRLYDRRFGRG